MPDLPDAQIDRLAADKEVTYRSLARALSATPGLHALLSLGVENKLRLALVTNAPRENAEQVLGALGLGDVFETMVVADETPHGKPDPGPYELALERLAQRADAAIADLNGGEDVLLPAGSMIMFHSMLVHSSRPDVSARPRRLLIYSHFLRSTGLAVDARNGPMRLREAPWEWQYQRLKARGEFKDVFKAPRFDDAAQAAPK